MVEMKRWNEMIGSTAISLRGIRQSDWYRRLGFQLTTQPYKHLKEQSEATTVKIILIYKQQIQDLLAYITYCGSGS